MKKLFRTDRQALFALAYLTLLYGTVFCGCHRDIPVKTVKPTIMKKHFGKVHGKQIDLFTMKSPSGMTASITNYGGIVTALKVPDAHGDTGDVVLGYERLEQYLKESPYFGAIVGRYANRIRQGKFCLGDSVYTLGKNNGENHLHGGVGGLDKKVWDAKAHLSGDTAVLVLHYFSPDGEEGYPGNLDITVTYSLTPTNELMIQFSAVTDKPTPVNLSHHGYFNLSADPGRGILDHLLQIDADCFTPVDSGLIPTGKISGVDGTPWDFREMTSIGARIGNVQGGYDHNWVLNRPDDLRKVATLKDPLSGRVMEVITDQPGLQFYSGNFLDGSITGKRGIVYRQHGGLCLETQHFPDSPNQKGFPDTILRPGERYHHTVIYKFSAEKK
ncbi:MAG: galactose mutarotase [Bacteroidales bacterium]|nr:galactose mutarotase [Bacteroidales bacterium]